MFLLSSPLRLFNLSFLLRTGLSSVTKSMGETSSYWSEPPTVSKIKTMVEGDLVRDPFQNIVSADQAAMGV